MDIKGLFFNTKDYKLSEEKIGEGSFGSCYIATNNSTGKKYAAKILNVEDGFDGDEQMLLLRESMILHKVDHPSIVKYAGVNFKSFKKNKKLEPVILTEFMSHGSLKSNLDKEKVSLSDLSWSATKKYIMLLGVADAMRYLHKNGIIHRDLKPENVLVDEDFYPRVCDFGLSKCIVDSLSKSSKLLMTGQIGTPLYMAPELLRGENDYDSAVDVYAFSIMAYEIVTGKVPYYELGNVSPFVFANKVMSGYRPKLSKNVTDKMQILLNKCWNENPNERPSFEEIFDELSNNFDYIYESVDEEEISEYLSILSENRKITTKSNKDLENLLQEIESLKSQIKEIEKEQQNLNKTNNFFNSALEYLHGSKKERNLKEAVKYLNLSFNENCYSSFLLGLLYESGEGTDQDVEKAISLYQKSSEQGNPRGFQRIGYLYHEGILVEQNYSKAIEYLEKSAKLGDSDALSYLGCMYEYGEGVEQNYSKAIEYYEKSAELGDLDALNSLQSLKK